MTHTVLPDTKTPQEATVPTVDREKYFDDLHDLALLREYELNTEKDNLDNLKKEIELIEK